MNTLVKQYNDEVRAKLKEEFNLSNVHEVPKIQKIVLNVGLGNRQGDNRYFEAARQTLRKATGQQPVETKAKKSIAAFKLREGTPIGYKVTLRGAKAYDFLERFIKVVLPQVRDFRGVPKDAFDPQGNFSYGLQDQSVFPELTYDDMPVTHGLQVNVVIRNSSPDKSRMLLGELGMPFERRDS